MVRMSLSIQQCLNSTGQFFFARTSGVDHDVISGATVDNVGVDVRVKFSYSRSNGFRAIRGAGFMSNEHDDA